MPRKMKVKDSYKLVFLIDSVIDDFYIESWGCDVLRHESKGDGFPHFEIFEVKIPDGRYGRFRNMIHGSKIARYLFGL